MDDDIFHHCRGGTLRRCSAVSDPGDLQAGQYPEERFTQATQSEGTAPTTSCFNGFQRVSVLCRPAEHPAWSRETAGADEAAAELTTCAVNG